MGPPPGEQAPGGGDRRLMTRARPKFNLPPRGLTDMVGSVTVEGGAEAALDDG